MLPTNAIKISAQKCVTASLFVQVLCAIIATVLHFVILAGFAWMLCQGIHLAILSTGKLEQKSTFKWFLVIGYGRC